MEPKKAQYILSAYHGFQMLVAAGILITYGLDVGTRQPYVDGRWYYALMVGTVSFLLAALLAIPPLRRGVTGEGTAALCAVIAILGWVLFGIFAAGYMFAVDSRQKPGVWLDMINAILHTLNSIGYQARFMNCCCFARRSQFTGRADMNMEPYA
ncbi:hypothetical protein B0T24DRAFT_384138 [Lasiosphaeria ovina]|uniref:MARVEL domain-containing protein n=1 Tax=Lasiosphaeria ovina TaxID=92902 RepID=A0AAE0JZC8_9PEZI|nr:hypothetical protein B0T24DRAFT_384138 [Lasiosphaeria ovina]